ncbi:MAG TPA: hypothetical protein EYP53_08690 [Candidatus Latescibacteria bacterium]|nr:hypothetical protein [Candidatus Latescibacterota bacterium]
MREIFLYDDPATENLRLPEIAEYLRGKLPGFRLEVRQNFFEHHIARLERVERGRTIDQVAWEIASSRVRDLMRLNDEIDFEPLYGEVQFERRGVIAPSRKPFGILYDGYTFVRALYRLIPQEERGSDRLHMAFTNQLIGTWSPEDGRYHARVIICSIPCLISTTGVVEAPAKPGEFYRLKRALEALSRGHVDYSLFVKLKEQFSDRFVDYGDERLTEILKGYAMQAVFYHFWGGPFCDDPDCRLFNAHRQEEMIRAQVKSGRLCDKHEGMLKRSGAHK